MSPNLIDRGAKGTIDFSAPLTECALGPRLPSTCLDQAVILIDRADNNRSRRLESKQDTLKSQEEMDAERPAQTAALFSLSG